MQKSAIPADEYSTDNTIQDHIKDLKSKAIAPYLLPTKVGPAEDYDREKQMFIESDLKNLRKVSKTPLLPPESEITPNVRISSNKDDVDIDMITEKLMRNRTFHKDFDAVLGAAQIRQFVKDLVFQDSVLRPYKEFVDKKKQRISEADVKEMVVTLLQPTPAGE